MDDPIFKQKYQKYKLRVKLWEKDFKKKYSRIPSKYDIRDAPKEIRDSYKMYYKLKTSFLEDTLSDVLSEDGFDVLEDMSSVMDDSMQDASSCPQLPLDISSISNIDLNSSTASFSNLREIDSTSKLVNTVNLNEEHVIKEFEPVQENEHNQKAWGSTVIKKPPPPTKKSPSPVKQFKSNLNAKLFKAASFSMRNPRKSLSRPNKDISQSQPTSAAFSETSVSVEDLPDLETILAQRAKEIPVREPNIDIMSSIGLSKPEKMAPLQLDAGWLKRNVADDDEEFVKATKSRTAVPMGLSNINVGELEKTSKPTVVNEEEVVPEVPTSFGIHHDSDSVVSNSEDENKSQEYRHIAKRRRVLTTIDRNQQTDKLQSKEPEKDPPSIQLVPPTIEEKAEENSSEEEGKKPKKPRKKATAKRAKPAAKKNVKKEPPTKAEPRKTTRGRKKRVEEESQPPEDEEGTAPDIGNVKYTLALETSRVASLPRANIDDLKQANSLAAQYINKFDTQKLKNENPEAPQPNEKRDADRGKLEAKMESGKLNENFVRINLKKKVFVRGKKTVNYSKYKKKLWKEKKASALTGPDMDMGGCDGGVLTCFNCGQTGHFARQCKIKGDLLLPNTVEIENESPFMTLDEAERLASQTAVAAHSRNLSKLPDAPNPLLCRGGESEASDDDNQSQEELVEIQETPSEAPSYVGHKIPEDFLKKAGLLDTPNIVSETGPLYDLNPDGSVIAVTDEVREALHLFGHSDFRKGQDRAIMRILSGQSTLVTLSTGSGKSLCYQLPAYLYSQKKRSITLVISPLVSLMEDQVHGVPHFLRAHCLHTNQTPQQRMNVLEMINNGEVDVLLLSPEAVVAGERSTGFGSILRKLPPIAFACIDEAHCVSQWSHNFRPSYLMICKVLHKNLGVKTVLGLTATATLPTRHSIIRHLGIPDGEKGIISDIPLPDNLIISVSKDENREAALIELLYSERFSSCQSIIIYCTRRDECENVAGKLRTYMQDTKNPAFEGNDKKKKRKRVSWQAEPYHAGLPASRRRTIQNAFMRNELRIVVATIAFGMGINKPDIRSVIHYNMPRNFESYVQEIGRAGRDGKISHCHLFLDSRGNDQNELRRHIYANSIDRHVIRKLLLKIFIPCSCDKNLKKSEFVKEHADEIKASQDIDWDEDVFNQDDTDADKLKTENKKRKRICPGHEIGFSIEETVSELDIPEENISTLLCYLELDGRWGINVLSSAYIMCKVISYSGPKYMKHAAKDCPPLAMAIAQKIKNKSFDEESNVIEFSVIDIAAAIGWNSGVVKHQLKNLEWVNENGYPKRSPLSVQLSNLGFRITAPGDFTLDEIDEALDTLYNRAVKQETTQLIQLQYVFQGLSSVSYKSFRPCAAEDYPHDRSDKLKIIIRDYFQNDYPTKMVLEPVPNTVPDDAIIGDIHSIINMYPDNNFSGRNIARIFHGIQSPNFPAVIWGRCKFWRAHSKSDFNRIVKLGNSVIIKMRT